MADIVDARTRSRMMSKIKSSNTTPEKVIRTALHRRGFRFSLHRKDLPGTPDIVLPAYNTAIFVHGCFWHYHECKDSRLPTTNREFWIKKFMANRQRDQRNLEKLFELNWYVAIVWECSVRDTTMNFIDESIDDLGLWLRRTKFRRRLKVVG